MLSLFANPTVPFPSPYERASRALQLKADELGRRLVHLGSAVGSPWTQDEKLAALVAWLSLVYSGLRISDAVSLKRDRISDAGRLFLYTQKKGKPVHIKLPPVVIRVIEAADDGELFWNFRGTLKSRLTEWQELLKKIAAIASIQGRGFAHRLRDSFAVDLFNHGVSIENVAVLLGNTPAVVARHYNPFVESRQVALDRAVEAIWK